jgi:hypothetical protein
MKLNKWVRPTGRWFKWVSDEINALIDVCMQMELILYIWEVCKCAGWDLLKLSKW